MKRTSLTRVQNKNNGNFICVKENFDNGISLIYKEDKNYIYAKPYKTNGNKFFSKDEQKEIDDHLKSKGFKRPGYFKDELVGLYWLCKFKELDRTFEDISNLIFDKNNVKRVGVEIDDENALYDYSNKYDVVKDFCTYLCGNSDNENIEIERNRLDIVDINVDGDIWNSFCKRYNYEFTSKHGCVILSIWFNENDEIREIYSLLKDNAIKNIDNVESTTAESCHEYIDIKKRG